MSQRRVGTDVRRPFVARTIRKYSLVVALAWVALLIAVNVVVPQLEPVTEANRGPLVPLDAPSAKALIHTGEVFNESDSNSLLMVVLEGSHKLGETDHSFYHELVAKLKRDKHIQYVMDLWGEGTTAAGVQSNDGQASYTLVRVAGSQGSSLSDESIHTVRDLVSQVKTPPGLKVYVSGAAPLSADMLEVGNKSLITIMFVTIICITVMLLLVYRSIATALLILSMVMMELICGRGVVSFLAFHKFTQISEFASNILVSLILGAGTDYAIFLIGRYHEARHAGENPESAYYSAVGGVSHVILGSGLAVAGATFCLRFTRLNYFNTCGIPCAAAMLTAVAAALTFGPALLALGSRLGFFEPKRPAGAGIWRKVGTLVVRWPGRLLLASCVVVLVGSVTLPTYRPNYDDRLYIADDIPSKQGYAASDRHFPVSRLNSDMLLLESWVAQSAVDVQAAVAFDKQHRPVLVKTTGHQIVGTAHGAVLITTHRMNDVTIDGSAARPSRRGSDMVEVVQKAAEAGLAPLNGSNPTVGVAGYTLGGGLSPTLGRSHGYAADHVRSLDVVTADGELRYVDAESDPELFWALRGGKGNFGVVTALEFDLFPVFRLYGGGMYFPGERMADVLRAWTAWHRSTPETMVVVVRCAAAAAAARTSRTAARIVSSGSAVRLHGHGGRRRADDRAAAGSGSCCPGHRAGHAVHRGRVDPQRADRTIALLRAGHHAAGVPRGGAGHAGRTGRPELRRHHVDRRTACPGRGVGPRACGAQRRSDQGPAVQSCWASRSVRCQKNGGSRESVAALLDGMEPWQGDRRLVNNLAPEEAADAAAIYGPERYQRLAAVKKAF